MRQPERERGGFTGRRFVGLRLALRGIAYRRLTALVVLVLAVVAATAAVVAPLYARAAEESIARSALTRSDVFARAVHADVSMTAAAGSAGPSGPTAAYLSQQLRPPVFGTPRLSVSTTGLVAPAAGPQAGTDVEVPLMARPGLCQHLTMAAGRCAKAPDEAVMTTRSAALLGLRPGETFTERLTEVQDKNGAQVVTQLRLVGTVAPFDVDDDYWVGRQFSTYYPHERPNGLTELPAITDSMLLGDGAAARLGIGWYAIDVPVDPQAISLDDGPALTSLITSLQTDLGRQAVAVTSQLPALLQTSQRRTDVVRVAAPLAAFQLVLLAWVILAHVVGSATQERAPELGLAKLRGLTPRRTVRFGLAEVVVLLLVSAPIGTVLGWWVVHEVVRVRFAPGIPLRLSGWVAASVLVGVLGGIAAAAVAARGVARGHVADLLRRVPGHGRARHAGAVEGVVLALVAAGIVQLVVAPDAAPGPVASAAPGVIALGGALLAARVLRWVSGRRADRALERGHAGALVGWAGVARRAGTARTTGVLAAALCLLLVGVQAWTVAARERSARALAENGAAVVLDVQGATPRALLDTVRRADPGGGYAMAAVHVPGDNQHTEMMAVDGTRAERVVGFGARRPDHLTAALRPAMPASVLLRPGVVSATAAVSSVSSPSPLRLSVTVDTPSGWLEVDLGDLRVGSHTYTGQVPAACAAGCRLVALTVRHPGLDLVTGRASLSVSALAAGPTGQVRPLDAGFDRSGGWREGVVADSGAHAAITPGTALRVDVETPVGFPARIMHGDAPLPLPGLGAPQTPEQDGATTVTGLDGASTPVRLVSRAQFTPRLGPAGVLVDLELALRNVPEAEPGDLQVWLSRDDPSAERALRTALASSGMSVTDRSAAAQVRAQLSQEGAVLALLLFLGCGFVAVLVAVGAMLVAAFVGARQRAAEVAALRAVGVRRRVLRRALLLENLAGVGVALGCAVVAAAVAALVVLPVLPLADEASSVLVLDASPDLLSGAWSVVGVAVVLAVVAVVVASAQLRGGVVDRMRDGAR